MYRDHRLWLSLNCKIIIVFYDISEKEVFLAKAEAPVSATKISADDYDALLKRVSELQKDKDDLGKELGRLKD